MYDYREHVRKVVHAKLKAKHTDFDVRAHNLYVRDNVKLTFYDKDYSHKDDHMFDVSFHTAFIESNYLCFEKLALDRACKDHSCRHFDPAFVVELYFLPVRDLTWGTQEGFNAMYADRLGGAMRVRSKSLSGAPGVAPVEENSMAESIRTLGSSLVDTASRWRSRDNTPRAGVAARGAPGSVTGSTAVGSGVAARYGGTGMVPRPAVLTSPVRVQHTPGVRSPVPVLTPAGASAPLVGTSGASGGPPRPVAYMRAAPPPLSPPPDSEGASVAAASAVPAPSLSSIPVHLRKAAAILGVAPTDVSQVSALSPPPPNRAAPKAPSKKAAALLGL